MVHDAAGAQVVVSLEPRFLYRWVLGDLTDMSDAQDTAYARELMN